MAATASKLQDFLLLTPVEILCCHLRPCPCRGVNQEIKNPAMKKHLMAGYRAEKFLMASFGHGIHGASRILLYLL